MKTLADFKRRLTVGTKLTYQFHPRDTIRGNTGTTVIEPKPPEERTVFKVQSNSVCFKRNDGSESWLEWPKAAEIKFPDQNTAEIYSGPTKLITYKFV